MIFFFSRTSVDDTAEQMYYLLALSSSSSEEDGRAWIREMAAKIAALSLPTQPSTIDTSSEAEESERDDDSENDESGRAKRQSRDVEWKLQFEKAKYEENVRNCLRYIRAGETYELCLTHQITASLPDRGSAFGPFDPFQQYRKLRRQNSAPYAAYFHLPAASAAEAEGNGKGKGEEGGETALHVLCSSPERLLKVSSQGEVTCKPIKGTRKRGRTEDEDAALAAELRTSDKDRAENLMITDLIRNDLTKVCEPSSVHCPALMQVESYATVHQLVSTIAGQLSPQRSAVDALRAVFPAGSMTGAPKLRSTEILETIEQVSS